MQELTFEQVEVVSGGFFEVNSPGSAASCDNLPAAGGYSDSQAESFWGAVSSVLRNPLGSLFYSAPVGQGSEMPPAAPGCEEGRGSNDNPDTTLPGGGGEGLPKP